MARYINTNRMDIKEYMIDINNITFIPVQIQILNFNSSKFNYYA